MWCWISSYPVRPRFILLHQCTLTPAPTVRPIRSAHLPAQTLSPFQSALAHIHELATRLDVQRHGLRIAGGNLLEHVGKLIEGSSPTTNDEEDVGDGNGVMNGWPGFQRLIEVELERERGLIGPAASTAEGEARRPVWGMEQDMQVISGIEVHDVFVKRPSSTNKRRSSNVNPPAGASATTTGKDISREGRTASPTIMALERVSSGEKRKLLKDYVNHSRMKVVRDNCQRVYGTSSPLLPSHASPC